MMDCVRLTSASASSLLFVASIFLMEVRRAERVLLLRILALSAWRRRFFEDANVGKGFTSLRDFFKIQSAKFNHLQVFAQPISHFLVFFCFCLILPLGVFY